MRHILLARQPRKSRPGMTLAFMASTALLIAAPAFGQAPAGEDAPGPAGSTSGLTSDPEQAIRNALHHQIEAILASQPDYEALTPDTAVTFRSSIEPIQTKLSQWGKLEIVNPYPALRSGWYVYQVVFDNALVEWAVKPLDAQGKITGLAFKTLSLWSASNRKSPSPGTEDFLRRHIESLENGRPNYQEMTPGLARAVHQQLPGALNNIRQWGALKSITFLTVEPNGLDEYATVFEHGQAIWWIGPWLSDGKIGTLFFRNVQSGVSCCQVGSGP
jgi:hypothetical protein